MKEAPSPAPELPTVPLKIVRRSDHPWIFQKMVDKPSRRPPPGTVVNIVDREGQWVGRGFYNGHSRIALRVLTSDPREAIDASFFARRLGQAIALRRELLHLDEVSDAYRLVHSEGDGLSGLVVDRFGPVLVLEFFAAGMFRFRDIIRQCLQEHFPDALVYWFAERHIQKQESFDCHPPEPPPPQVICEHQVRFLVAPGSQHKTGFFLDQRENRHFLASFCPGKRVLDLCCNSGGFAVHAKVAGAREVVGVDLDEQALELARQNARLNQVRVRFVQADLFPWLRDVVLKDGQRYDVVVLDPAKQTRDREEVSQALKRYLDMNRLALRAVVPGGVFLTCSCTGLITEEDFLHTLRKAAWQAGKSLQIIRIAGAGGDHPYLAHVPESRYLKAVFCRVQDRGTNTEGGPSG